MKITIITLVVLLGLILAGLKFRGSFSATIDKSSEEHFESLYDLQSESLTGETVDLDKYRGHVVLVVNTASKCGLTPQYEGLESLYREFSPQGFVVLGFPSNDFLGQEPGTSEEIALFCSENYQVTFPLFAKSKVKGAERSEIFQLLTAELEEPTWNFTKYLVSKDGHVVARFAPRIKPDHPDLRGSIEQELAVGSIPD